MISTITASSGIPHDVHPGSTLRIDGRGWVEVLSRTPTELKVIPVGPLNAALLEFNYALGVFLQAAGWFRLLGWIEALMARMGMKP